MSIFDGTRSNTPIQKLSGDHIRAKLHRFHLFNSDLSRFTTEASENRVVFPPSKATLENKINKYRRRYDDPDQSNLKILQDLLSKRSWPVHNLFHADFNADERKLPPNRPQSLLMGSRYYSLA